MMLRLRTVCFCPDERGKGIIRDVEPGPKNVLVGRADIKNQIEKGVPVGIITAYDTVEKDLGKD